MEMTIAITVVTLSGVDLVSSLSMALNTVPWTAGRPSNSPAAQADNIDQERRHSMLLIKSTSSAGMTPSTSGPKGLIAPVGHSNLSVEII
jgi:hypothetical protein